MSDKFQPTDSYKGVRDFYPEDMAIQRYIFYSWSKTAESFGFERYDASILEPSSLYKAKGAENEEMVNEQTYTFTDRGEREVTLRPEMTPTIARMVAAKKRELAFPLRWYSIPNLFRYERPQRGRLREHWQLNCDIFGSDSISADIEIISLAYQTMIDMGAKTQDFRIRISDRAWLTAELKQYNLDDNQMKLMIQLIDRKDKIENFEEEAESITGKNMDFDSIALPDDSNVAKVLEGLKQLGINNVVFSPTIVRGFNYYTGTVFEIFDTSDENNRALIGGGRYDNLTKMFGGEPVSGVGFGIGDVTMRDFLETHNLLPESIRTTAAHTVVIPTDAEMNLAAQEISQKLRKAGQTVSTDIGTKKVEKKIISADKKGSRFVIIIGEDEVSSGKFTAKNFATGDEKTGSLLELFDFLKA
ncbi:MAG: histidine--tRNA ligase [Candidatus Pacebacteria bacterium]|nr:histidine--tRNA ligase [Candidatus Paceibacterota bacterium]